MGVPTVLDGGRPQDQIRAPMSCRDFLQAGRGPRGPAAVLMLCAGTALAAAEPTVELRLGTRQAYQNEAFELLIEVRDFQTVEPPAFPPLPGCTVRALGAGSDSTQIVISGGRRHESRSRIYAFELTPSEVGELLVPPIEVRVDGRTLRTRAARVTVGPSDADELFAVEVVLDRQRVYVGQRVTAVLRVAVRPARFGNQWLDAATMLRCVQPIEFGPFPRQVQRVSEQTRNVGGQEVRFFVYQFAAEFVPEEPGPLRFDQVEVGLAYPTAGGATRNLRRRPTVPPLEVRPVPMEGRPPNYAGAVGLFNIETRAMPTEVRVGDPIELTIDIFGDGPVERLPPPLLSATPGLADQFRLPVEPLTGELVESRRRFRVTLRALRTDVQAIPALEYPYFDPDAERFVVARSRPIPLTVSAAAEAVLPEVAPRAASPGGPVETLDGLRDVETSEVALLARAAPPGPRAVEAWLIGPPLAFGLVWLITGAVQRRRGNWSGTRRARTPRAARRALHAARARTGAARAAAVSAALAQYLADRLGEPIGRCAGPSGAAVLLARGASSETRTAWEALSARCAEAAFAGGDADEDLVDAALALLARLERESL